jgi:putative ABC transport system permease protein
MSRIPGPSRAMGAAAGSTLALALLVCGCVFAAVAGPALSLHTQSQALHQSLAGLAASTDVVQANAEWLELGTALEPKGAQGIQAFTRSELDQAGREIGQGFAAGGLPLAAGAWAGVSSMLWVASGTGPRAVTELPPQLEVVYRDPLPSNARIVAGTYATSRVPAGAMGVAATTQMAYRFGLHPGSRLTLDTTDSGLVQLFVTAIVAERAPASTFWMQDPTVGTPSLNDPATHPYWVGGVIADPDQLVAMEDAFGDLEMNWEFPVAVGGVSADAAQGLYDALNRATITVPSLTGKLAPAAHVLTVTSPLIAGLSPFLATQAAIETVLLLMFVSLIVIGATVILIAARMIVARREVELAVLRARGGSLGQVAAVVAGSAVLAAVPGALVGAGLAVALIPGGTAPPAVAWWLAGITVAVALAGPSLVAAWQHRRPAPAANPAQVTTADTGRPRVAWRRPVAELTAIAAAAGGLVVLHDQGAPAGGGIDLYLTITPVLVAIPAVVIMLRLYPLAVRGLLRLSARGTGATGFVAMSRAARSSLTGVLPAFALVLALSLATFAGMTSNGITRGEIAASWHTTGADAVIDAGPFPVTPSALSAIAAVRGVRHATAVWSTSWVTTPAGQPLTVIQVDPAGYAALVAGTPFPAFPANRIGAAPGGVRSSGPPVPVLASPDAAALLGNGATQLSSSSPEGPFTVRVAGTLDDTPAEPGGGTFVIMPLERLPGATGRPAPNVVLVTGSGIDDAQLSAVAARMIPQAVTSFRSAVLASLASSPLQHGAVLIIGLTIATAAAFGLFIVILGLALGSAERELTLARLTVMGHERETRLVMAEAMPTVIAAMVAGAACALALPHVVGSSIDLSAFTGTSAPVQLQPDALAFGLPAVVVMLLALAALTAEARTLRRRGIVGMLREH